MTSILACGSNFFGQLGVGDRERSNPYDQTLLAVSEDQALDHDSVADVQCGAQFTVVLNKSGSLGICGVLNGTVFPYLNPIDIPLPIRCVAVACGRKHVVLLMERNVVMSFGTGYFGQLGHNNDSSWDSPRVIQALEARRLGSKVVDIACGGSHSGAVTDAGRVFMWGLNRSGQCGLGAVSRGKTDSILEPRLVDFGGINVNSKEVGGIQKLVCGRSHSAVLTGTGRVFTWGDAGYGRLGLNDVRKSQPVPAEVTEFRSTPARALAAGDFHMMALTRDREVYSWGYGADGQTGHCAMLNVRLPKRVAFFDGKDVVSVACGASWSLAITAEGTLYCCGYGDGGWLGVQPPSPLPQVEVDNLTPLQASQLPDHQREICCFDSRHSVLRPRLVDSLADYRVRSVRAGAGHTIAICDRRTGETSTGQQAAATGSATTRVPGSGAGAGVKAGVGSLGALGAASAVEEEDSAFALGGGVGIADLGERKPSFGVRDREVSSKMDAKRPQQQQQHHHLPVASHLQFSAGDASGSNSSISSAFAAQQKASSSSGLAISTASAVSRASSFSGKGPGLPLSPNSATVQLFSWVRHRKLKELEGYLESGGDPNVQDSAGNTPLIVACQNGHLQACKLLLKHGADLNASNLKGNSALHYCFSYGYDDIGTYLIESGANDEHTNADGLTCYEGLTYSDLENL